MNRISTFLVIVLILSCKGKHPTKEGKEGEEKKFDFYSSLVEEALKLDLNKNYLKLKIDSDFHITDDLLSALRKNEIFHSEELLKLKTKSFDTVTYEKNLSDTVNGLVEASKIDTSQKNQVYYHFSVPILLNDSKVIILNSIRIYPPNLSISKGGVDRYFIFNRKNTNGNWQLKEKFEYSEY